MPVCPDCKDGAVFQVDALSKKEELDERICDECGEPF